MKSISIYLLYVGEQAGKAEEAVKFYTSLFSDAEISSIEHYDAGEHEPEGFVRYAHFSIAGVEFVAMDSGLDHLWKGFTPGVSMFIECDSLEELERAYHALADGGEELLAKGEYVPGQTYGWLNDKYGVSWQLNFAG